MSVQQFDENNYPIELPDDLTTDERTQVNAVAATPDPTGHSTLKTAAALGGAYILYQTYMRARLKNKLQGVQNLPPDKYAAQINSTFSDFMPAWTYMVTPAIFSSYMSGAMEAGHLPNSRLLTLMAERYSWSLGNYLNQKSVQAAVKGYQAQLNRNIDSKLALGNSVDAIAVTLPGVRTLVGLWEGKDAQRPSEALLPSVRKARINKVITTDVNQHADLLGDQESYSQHQTGKQVAWTSAMELGVIPANSTREWVTSEDEKVCPQCGPMDHAEVPVNEPFSLGKLKFWTPSLHVKCRCQVKLKGYVLREIGGRAVQQIRQVRDRWASTDDQIPDFLTDDKDVAKADWDEDEHPRDSSTGRFSNHHSGGVGVKTLVDYPEPEPEHKQELETKVESKPVLIARRLPQQTGSYPPGSLVSRRSPLVSRQPAEAKQEQAAPATSLVARPLPLIARAPSLVARPLPLIARTSTATRVATPVTVTTTTPAPPRPGHQDKPKRNYKSTDPGKPLLTVATDQDMKAYLSTVHGEANSFDFPNVGFTTDEETINNWVNRFRADRFERLMQAWSQDSPMTNRPTMSTGRGDEFYVLDRNVLASVLSWAESDLVLETMGHKNQDKTVMLRTATRPGMSPSGVPPQTTGAENVTYSDIADYFHMKRILEHDQPTVLQVERYADDNLELPDTEVGGKNVWITDKYRTRGAETRHHPEGYGAIRVYHLDPADDDD